MDSHARRFLLVSAHFVLLASLSVALGCGEENLHDCIDGLDNDNDGVVDRNDLGCFLNETMETPDLLSSNCADGRDNDDDGRIDYPEDPGCYDPEDDDERNNTTAACRDGLDNDGDGLVDFPNDPGCFSSLTNDESDNCPEGERCPQCKNNRDDDGDGNADFPEDPGCDSAADALEEKATTTECGTQAVVKPLPAEGLENGAFDEDAIGELVSPSCGGTGSETVYTFEFSESRILMASTLGTDPDVDTVIYIRDECRASETELACNDDADVAWGLSSALEVELPPGAYYLVVDSYSPSVTGAYQLQTVFYTAPGERCGPESPACLPEQVCRPRDTTTTETTCELPSCMDGIDNEGDGIADYPFDPGCLMPTDNDEADPCPGTGCPRCANGVDDDLDGAADYPVDPHCQAASEDSELDCSDSDLIVPIAGPVTVGTTALATNDFTPYCALSSTAPEVMHELQVPGRLVSLTANTFGATFNTVLHLKRNSCAGNGIICNNDAAPGVPQSQLTTTNVSPGTYFLSVDGFGAEAGSYLLNVTGVIALGEPCNPAQVSTGLFTCIGATTCSDTGSGFVCQ